jgi:hypothetical protein
MATTGGGITVRVKSGLAAQEFRDLIRAGRKTRSKSATYPGIHAGGLSVSLPQGFPLDTASSAGPSGYCQIAGLAPTLKSVKFSRNYPKALPQFGFALADGQARQPKLTAGFGKTASVGDLAKVARLVHEMPRIVARS